jgi:hypothetical protein
MISSFTVPIIRAPVCANLCRSRPSAFFVMSAEVPCTGVLSSSVIFAGNGHCLLLPLRVLASLEAFEIIDRCHAAIPE